MPQRRTIDVSAEMLGLFRRGLELIAAGHDDVDDHGPEAVEFRAISKRLCWSLLHVVTVIVFDRRLDGPPPSYATPAHALYHDWGVMQGWKQALQSALLTYNLHKAR